MLRVCERFGLDPLDGIERMQAMDPGHLAVLIEFERGRQIEEFREIRNA